jgi:hypothetical protein
MIIPRTWFVEQVTVATKTGDGAYGSVLATPVTVLGNVDSRAVLVRNSAGAEVLAQQVLRFPPAASTTTGTVVDPLAVFTPDSEVTVNGRAALVLTVKPFTIRGAVGYVEVTTT